MKTPILDEHVRPHPSTRLDPGAEELLNSADLLVWCTMGQRAWALTEIAIVEKLPAAVLEKSILAVTRSDYLRNDSSKDLVFQRLQEQAGKFFDKIIMVEAGRNEIEKSGEDAHWAETGGQELYDNVVAEFRDYQFAGVRPVVTERSADLGVFASARGADGLHIAEEVAVRWRGEVDAVADWIDENADANEPSMAEHMLERVKGFDIAGAFKNSADKKETAIFEKMFGRAARVLETAIGKTECQDAAHRCIDVMLQLEEELFAMNSHVHGA